MQPFTGKKNVTQDVNLMVNQLYAELRESEYYLDLYNKIITMLKRKEAWLVEAYYEQELTIGQIIAMPESPYYQYSRSTVYRHKERILHKADEFIRSKNATLVPILGEKGTKRLGAFERMLTL